MTDGAVYFEQEKEGILKRLGKRYAVKPPLGGHERTTIDGKRKVTVYGCRKILIYSPTEIRLMLAKEELSIVGDRLYCSSFSAGVVTVEGVIGGVLYREQRQRLFGEGKART